MQAARSRTDQIFVWITVLLVVGIFVSANSRLFMLDRDGLSFVSRKLPYWDFTNLWAGGKLVWQGKIHAIPDAESFRAWLRAELNPHLPDQEWSYPPSLLLLGVPIALLPLGAAYAFWQALSFLVLYLATRFLELPLAGRIAILLSPAALTSAALGQNGLLTGGLIISSLSLMSRRPWLAGVLVGLLTMKPQLGILLPFCMLASRNYRSLAAASVTAALLAVATGILFGFDVWLDFWTKTRPLMTAILDRPFDVVYPVHEVTVFASLRSFGATLQSAYAVQFLMTAACIVACLYVWRPACRMEAAARVCLTGILTTLATPYGHDYDLVPVAAALMWIFFYERNVRPSLVLFAFVSPVFFLMARKMTVCLDPVLLLALSIHFVHGALRADRAGIGNEPATVRRAG